MADTGVAREQIDPVFEFASQAEAQAGTENTKIMTALRVKEAIDEFRQYASQAEAEAGAENTKIMTALRVAQAIAATNVHVHDHSDADNGGAAISSAVLSDCLLAVAPDPPPEHALGSQSVMKAWANIQGTAVTGPATIMESFNIVAASRISIGHYRVDFDRDFSSTNYAIFAIGQDPTQFLATSISNKNVAYAEIFVHNISAAGAFDPPFLSVMAVGDQA